MIKPLHDQILIELEEKDNVTKTGLILARTENDTEPDKGIVLATGPGRVNDNGVVFPVSVSVGDKVLFAKYAGHLVKKDDKKYVLVSEKDIIAILGGDED